MEVERRIAQTALLDQKRPLVVDIWMEQEPGSSGVNTIDHYAREVLVGYSFRGDKVTGDKETRAAPLSSAAEAGNVKLVLSQWVEEFLDEQVKSIAPRLARKGPPVAIETSAVA